MDGERAIRETVGGRENHFRERTALPPQFAWRLLDLRDDGLREQARQAAARICGQDPRAALEHDFDWFLGEAAREGAAAHIWLCHAENDVVGYAPLMSGRSNLDLGLGETTLASLRIDRHRLVGCPLFAPAVMEHEARMTAALIAALRRALPRRGALFLLGARADSAFYAGLGQADTLAHFFVQNHGPAYNRRFIRLPESYERYLASLGRNTRSNVHRYDQKLLGAATGDIELRRFMSRAEIEPFLEAAIPVSRQTYQWRNLGLGLHDGPLLAQQLSAAAERGIMLCYALFDGSKPLSFLLGYKFRGTYYAHHTGYDPRWAKFWVGNQLLCRVVRDLIENHPDIRCLDLLYGDTPNKARFSNGAREEGNFYLLPRTAWGAAAFLSLRACNAASAVTGNLLLRLGLKEKVRQMLRR